MPSLVLIRSSNPCSTMCSSFQHDRAAELRAFVRVELEKVDAGRERPALFIASVDWNLVVTGRGSTIVRKGPYPPATHVIEGDSDPSRAGRREGEDSCRGERIRRGRGRPHRGAR